MVQLSMQADFKQIARVQSQLAGWPRGLARALSLAVNDTTRQVRMKMARGLTKTVNLKLKDVAPLISRTNASPAKPTSQINFKESARVSLKRFGAKQTKRGVTYKIKKGGSRSRLDSGFGPKIVKLNQGAFKRVTKSRFPITKLHGPSPAVAFIGEELDKVAVIDASTLLSKNLDRRVRFLLLKRQGVI